MRRDRRPYRPVREAVEGRRADRRAEEGDASSHDPQLRSAGERPAKVQRPVLPPKRRKMAEEVEVDAEGVPVAAPAPDPEQPHPHQLDAGVGKRDDRELARVVLVDVCELEPRESQDPEHGRPAPKPGRILELPVRAVSERPPAGPGSDPTDGKPGVERAKDVPEEDAQHDEPDPEVNVDEGRGEVRGRLPRAREPAIDDEREQAHSYERRDDVDRNRDPD